MEFRKATVKLERIETENNHYRFSDQNYDRQALKESIATYGILNPIVAVEKGNRFQVVSGFRRLEVASKLEVIDVPAYLTGTENCQEDLFKFSILENRATRSLALGEKSALLAKLGQAGVEESRIISHFMPLLQLPPSRQRMKEILILARLPESMREYLLAKNISLRRIRHLEGLSPKTLGFFNELIELLKPSSSLFEEVTRQLIEVSKRDNRDVEQIVSDSGLMETAKEQSIGREEKLRVLRSKIFSLRYPVLAGENQRRKEQWEALELGPHLDVKWDRSLEGKGVEIRISLNSEEDLENCLKHLENIRSSRVLKEYI